MNGYLRRLDASDLTAMGQLRMSRATHAGLPISRFTTAPILSVSDRYVSAPNLAVGWFEDQKLEAFICAYAHKDFWVLDLMVASGNPKHLHACLSACLEHYESRGVYQFFYAFPIKWARAYKSFWRESVPLLQKYTLEDLTTVEARKIPKDKWIWEHILHQIIIPVDLLLRRSYYKDAP